MTTDEQLLTMTEVGRLLRRTTDEQLLTVAEVGRLLRRSIWSVYADAAAGRLPAIRVGGTVRFRRSDIESWLDANRIKASASKRRAVVAGQKATALTEERAVQNCGVCKANVMTEYEPCQPRSR